MAHSEAAGVLKEPVSGQQDCIRQAAQRASALQYNCCTAAVLEARTLLNSVH
jgi:hypothetical protein